MTEQEKEKINDECEKDLKEIAHWYGGWDELQKVIERLKDNEAEAAHERFYANYQY